MPLNFHPERADDSLEPEYAVEFQLQGQIYRTKGYRSERRAARVIRDLTHVAHLYSASQLAKRFSLVIVEPDDRHAEPGSGSTTNG